MLNEKGSLINNIYYGVVRFLMKKVPVDKFICWSNYYWEKHLKEWGILTEKVAIIPAGIDTDVYNPGVDGSEIKNKYAPDNPLIVFAKPLYSVNTESAKVLVQSVAVLQREIRVKLLIGSGDGKDDVQKLARDLGVFDLVDFMPPTPFPKIPEYIAAADLIVLPFTYAPTTSRSVLEAMAMGKPIITTPVGENKKIFGDGKNAILVESDPCLIAAAMKILLSDNELRHKLGANAWSLAKNKFSLPMVVNETMAVFTSLKRGI
jgi:glycosyltransferase involved in cell wall biosynthesis